MHACIHTYTHVYTYIHTYIYIYIYIYIYRRMYARMHARMYILLNAVIVNLHDSKYTVGKGAVMYTVWKYFKECVIFSDT